MRADAVDRLTGEGWAQLLAHGIRTIVDLRNEDELLPDRPPRPEEIETVHLPLDGVEDEGFWKRWRDEPPPLYCAHPPRADAGAVGALGASGLGDLFDAGDLGVGKPEPYVFHHALHLLAADPWDATMVGDSLTCDIDGAIDAGLRAVWLNRFRRPPPAERPDVTEITTLDELKVTLDDMS